MRSAESLSFHAIRFGIWGLAHKKRGKKKKKEVFLEGCTDRGRWRRCGSAHRGLTPLGDVHGAHSQKTLKAAGPCATLTRKTHRGCSHPIPSPVPCWCPKLGPAELCHAWFWLRRLLHKRIQKKGNLTHLCLCQVSSASFP